MFFSIDYGADITLVKCREWDTLTIIIRNDDTGMLESLDTWCAHQPAKTYSGDKAVVEAMQRATFCTKQMVTPAIYEEIGDKASFLGGYPLAQRIHQIQDKVGFNLEGELSWKAGVRSTPARTKNMKTPNSQLRPEGPSGGCNKLKTSLLWEPLGERRV